MTAYLHPIHLEVRRPSPPPVARGLGRRRRLNEAVREACGDLAAKAAVGELAVEPLRLDGAVDPQYVSVQLSRLQLFALNRRIADVKSRLQRMNPVTNQDEHFQLFGELVSLEQQLAPCASRPREDCDGALRPAQAAVLGSPETRQNERVLSWASTSTVARSSSPLPSGTGRDRLGWDRIHKATSGGPSSP
jgi:hypothetical protein